MAEEKYKNNFVTIKDKYTSDEFMVIFKERSNKLFEEYKTLTSEQIKKRFSELFDDCPIGLHIDPFGLINALNEQFPNWNGTGKGKRIYKIETDEKYLKNINFK